MEEDLGDLRDPANNVQIFKPPSTREHVGEAKSGQSVSIFLIFTNS